MNLHLEACLPCPSVERHDWIGDGSTGGLCDQHSAAPTELEWRAQRRGYKNRRFLAELGVPDFSVVQEVRCSHTRLLFVTELAKQVCITDQLRLAASSVF